MASKLNFSLLDLSDVLIACFGNPNGLTDKMSFYKVKSIITGKQRIVSSESVPFLL